MKKLFTCFVSLVLIVALSGCAGTTSSPTQQSNFQLAGSAIASAIVIAEAVPAVQPYAASINLAVSALCELKVAATDPATAMTQMQGDIADLWTQLAGPNNSLAGQVAIAAAVAVINTGWSTLQADVANSESSVAMADIQAFLTGLCSVATTKGICKVKTWNPEPTATSSLVSVGNRLKWDVQAAFVNGLYLIGVRR